MSKSAAMAFNTRADRVRVLLGIGSWSFTLPLRPE
jgi:hypothetical protein